MTEKHGLTYTELVNAKRYATIILEEVTRMEALWQLSNKSQDVEAYVGSYIKRNIEELDMFYKHLQNCLKGGKGE